MGIHIEFDTFFKKRRILKKNFPTGTTLFTGAQGNGKTLSATHYIQRLKKSYPDVYVYSNIDFALADMVIRPEDIPEYILDQRKDERPIVFFLDEIQTVLFNKASKSVSFETLRAIAQQRKAQKTIIGTLQNYLDLDIQYRRQVKRYVECSHVGPWQFEEWKSGEDLKFDQNENAYVGKNEDFRLWKRHNDAYDVYDTFEIVKATLNMDNDAYRASQRQKQVMGSAPT